MGKCFFQLGRLLEAKLAYQRAIDLEPASMQLRTEVRFTHFDTLACSLSLSLCLSVCRLL
jgi:predicted RNA polymerase sigma factor